MSPANVFLNSTSSIVDHCHDVDVDVDHVHDVDHDVAHQQRNGEEGEQS